METSFTIRSIAPDDNVEIARIIRACLKEFGADKPGTVYYEESTDHLFEVFRQKDLDFILFSLYCPTFYRASQKT